MSGVFDWKFPAALIEVTDGDTIKVQIDQGFCVRSLHSVRLSGINAPEIFSGSVEERQAGQASKRAVFAWLLQHEACARRGEFPFVLSTDRDRRSFNRYIGTVACAAGHELVPYLIENGFGVPA